VALLCVALVGLVGASTLSLIVLTDDGPDRCCPAPSAAAGSLPSPTSRPASSRAAGVPMCLIGTWRSVDEKFMIKFYTDQPEMPFVASGRVLEFRPDGTATERLDNVVFSGTFRGNQLRIVGNGAREYRWTASGTVITYIGSTSAQVTYSYYDQRGFLSSQTPPPNPNLSEQDPYTCQANQFGESNPERGYQSAWVRTAASGVYG
jgi:hypothetical protein